jgi:formate/nitrite transporter
MLKNWGFVYLGNLIGSVLLAFLLAKSGLYAGAAAERAMAVASSKASMPFMDAVIRGILCNILVVLACWFQAGSKEMAGKILAVWFPIMMFVFAGFEHSVANMTYIPLGMFLGADVTIGGFLLGNLIPVTIGNLVGGALFIPVIYTLVYKD